MGWSPIDLMAPENGMHFTLSSAINPAKARLITKINVDFALLPGGKSYMQRKL